MPLPIALAALAAGSAAAAALGVKKGYDAYSDNAEAKTTAQKAEHTFNSGYGRLSKARERAQQALGSLGALKLEMWSEDLGRFSTLFRNLKNVRIEGGVGLGELKDFAESSQLGEMEKMALKAREVVAGGIASVGSGALAGVAAYGGAMTFASASTGTAISALSGAAASNATLAWFGGGSLAAGGAGMAGGTLVLGGIVAGPVLAVGGLVLSAKARANLANAKKHLSRAKAASSEMYTTAIMVDGIRKVVLDVEVVLRKLQERFADHLDEFEALQERSGVDWARFTEAERRQVQHYLHWAQLVKALLEAPILTEAGALNEAHVRPLHEARKHL